MPGEERGIKSRHIRFSYLTGWGQGTEVKRDKASGQLLASTLPVRQLERGAGSVFLNRLLGLAHRARQLVLLCWGHGDKVPQSKWLKQQTFIPHGPWRLEVQDPGVGGLVSPEASLLGV